MDYAKQLFNNLFSFKTTRPDEPAVVDQNGGRVTS